MLSDKDNNLIKQKNEWAEIYGNMKQEIEGLKKDNRALQLQIKSGGGDKETAKKLKKRENECQALWDTLKDMHVSGKNIFDVRQMQDLLALRQLDTKAKRKLKI